MSQAQNQKINNDNQTLSLKVAGMDCGSCAMTIEKSIRSLPGIEHAEVSFTTETLSVEGNTSLEQIEKRLQELGYKIAEATPNSGMAVPERHGLKGFLLFIIDQGPLRNACAVGIAVILGLLFLSSANPLEVAGVNIEPLDLVFIAAVLIAGAPVFLKGMRALLVAKRITIDILMAIACIGALGIGEYGEAVTVILLFMLGEALEAYSAERARDSLRSLLALQPQEATVLEHHHDGEHSHSHYHDHDNDEHNHSHEDHNESGHDHTKVVPVEQVSVGDRILVRPAQRIPVDGVVIKGHSSVNQAPVTGESMPVEKTVEDVVMASTVNGEAVLEIKATKPASEGTIARIARLVEQAQAQRSPAERFIDRFAKWYTPSVVVLAALIVAVPVLGFGQPLLSTADGTTGWLYRGLAMLIIACPCALVISIPVTVVSGLTRLANLGVLVKSGALLDRLADIESIAFDKTGTLTFGKPQVTTIRSQDCLHMNNNDTECGNCDNVVSIAAAVERSSEHPVAHAIVEAAKHRSGIGHLAHAHDVQAHPGKGVSGQLDGGYQVVVGNQDLMSQSMQSWDQVTSQSQHAKANGETIMYVAQDNKMLGYIGVQDELRPDSVAALDKLHGQGIHTVMLTGDHAQAAQRIADQVQSIDEVYAGLLPEDKLKSIKSIQNKQGAVAMVGDGINDAPALAQADIGIAMGSGGTAQAMETADVVLMQDNLNDVALCLRVAKKSRAIIKQNIILSLVLKLAFLALAIPGFATLWMAVLADVGATLLVTLNGMRLLKEK